MESSSKVTSEDAQSGLLRQTAHPVIVDQDDGGLIVQIYFYDNSAFQMGDNDALTTVAKEIAALQQPK